MMEKIEGVPEIVRFKCILEDTGIPFLLLKGGDIVFERHGHLLKVCNIPDFPGILKVYYRGFYTTLKAIDVIKYIDENFGNDEERKTTD